MTPNRFACAAFVVAGLLPQVALGQDSSAAAAADVLFRQGRQLHEEKKYAEACPKFAESYRLDPATGSLLALASCHEGEGKLASAWAEYNEVMERARRDGQAERVETARQRANALEPKLAKLSIMVAPGNNTPGLTVKRDAVVMGSGSLGIPLPVDRGEHVIEASAPGHQSFSRRITIADGATLVVTLPKLAPATGPIEPAPPGPAVAPRPDNGPSGGAPGPVAADKPAKEPSSFPFKPLGVVAIVGGVVSVGVGSIFGIQALSKNSESNSNNRCVGDVCDAQGVRLRRDARSAGNMSTGLIVLGGVLVGGGITLFVIGGAKDSKTAATLVPAVSHQSAGLSMQGAF